MSHLRPRRWATAFMLVLGSLAVIATSAERRLVGGASYFEPGFELSESNPTKDVRLQFRPDPSVMTVRSPSVEATLSVVLPDGGVDAQGLRATIDLFDPDGGVLVSSGQNFLGQEASAETLCQGSCNFDITIHFERADAGDFSVASWSTTVSVFSPDSLDGTPGRVSDAGASLTPF